MKRETVIGLVVFLIFMSVLFVIDHSFHRKTELIWSTLEAKYPVIEKHESFNYSKITSIHRLDPKRFRIHTNSWMITLDDSIKRDLIVGNELQTDERLHEILKIGDYLHKLPDSTSVTLFRIRGTDTLEFHFPLHGKNLRPLQ